MFSENGTKLLTITSSDSKKRTMQRMTYRGGYLQNENVKLTWNWMEIAMWRDLNTNHEREGDGTLVWQQLSNSLKRKCDKLITERPSTSILKEIASNKNSESLIKHDINRVLKNMNAAKLRTIPKLPSNLEELHKSVREYSLITKISEKILFMTMILSTK